MRLALAQIDPTVGDFAGNLRLILDRAEEAAQMGADLVMLPELAVCGYPPADLLEKTAFVVEVQRSVDRICEWTAQPGRPAVLVGAVALSGVENGKTVRNVAVLLDGGERVFSQAKRLLPFYDVFDEQRYFEPATEQRLTTVRGQTVAITICEDAWNDKAFWPRRRYDVDPVSDLMRQWPGGEAGPRLILNLSASPYWQGKRGTREEMLRSLARQHGATVAMVNQVGGNDSLIFDGTSLVVGPDGAVAARAKSFAEDILCFDFPTESAAAPTRASDERDEVAATWEALVLGTRDYLRKCGFRKALVGLSGGIDSAVVAAIAVDALGAANVMGVGMPSEYSSSGSVTDAEALARNLGVRFERVAIAGIFGSYMQALEPLFAGTEFGLAEENLQARTRGALLMALSNKTGALVLTTGNKSEMSVGYSTLYGDMVGGLAVIGDVWKTRVYALAEYANREREVIPRATITKPPSAELRPGQMDTDSLPPYDVLDPMLAAYVEHYASAEEIAQKQGVAIEMVREVLRLVERSEYKRQQAAPVLKVTEKAFGMGRRFPIAAKVRV